MICIVFNNLITVTFQRIQRSEDYSKNPKTLIKSLKPKVRSQKSLRNYIVKTKQPY